MRISITHDDGTVVEIFDSAEPDNLGVFEAILGTVSGPTHEAVAAVVAGMEDAEESSLDALFDAEEREAQEAAKSDPPVIQENGRYRVRVLENVTDDFEDVVQIKAGVHTVRATYQRSLAGKSQWVLWIPVVAPGGDVVNRYVTLDEVEVLSEVED